MYSYFNDQKLFLIVLVNNNNSLCEHQMMAKVI